MNLIDKIGAELEKKQESAMTVSYYAAIVSYLDESEDGYKQNK